MHIIYTLIIHYVYLYAYIEIYFFSRKNYLIYAYIIQAIFSVKSLDFSLSQSQINTFSYGIQCYAIWAVIKKKRKEAGRQKGEGIKEWFE